MASVTSLDELDELDDATLAVRARDDPRAFTVLFRRHVHDVHRFVRRRTGDDALADDLTALVFERCWTALPGFRLRHDSLRPWLMRVAANVLASHYRSDERRRRREHLVVVRDEPRGVSDPADAFADAALLAALGELSERHQEVLTLRFLADLSTEEIADVLGIARGHVAVLQYRALAELRRRMPTSHGGGHDG